MADSQLFFETVLQRAEGSPYVVTPTAEGFDVTLDVTDVRWEGLLSAGHVRAATTHHVRCSETSGTYTVLQQDDAAGWRADVGRGSVLGLHVARGRSYGQTRTWSFGDRRTPVDHSWGAPGRQPAFTLRPEEGRALVTTAGRELGWQERTSGVEKGARAVAAGVAVVLALALLVGLVLLILLS